MHASFFTPDLHVKRLFAEAETLPGEILRGWQGVRLRVFQGHVHVRVSVKRIHRNGQVRRVLLDGDAKVSAFICMHGMRFRSICRLPSFTWYVLDFRIQVKTKKGDCTHTGRLSTTKMGLQIYWVVPRAVGCN